MRPSLFTLLALTLLASSTALSRSFEISTSPRDQEFSPGADNAAYNVAVTPIDGYNATVNFRILTTTLPWISIKLSKNAINPPYTGGVTLTIDPKSGHIPGRHMIIIEGANGPAVSYDTCYLTVQPTRGWLHYSTANSPLTSNNILNMELDRNGVGWLVLENGLARFDQTNWTLFSMTDLDGRPTGALAIDSTGGVWVGLSSGFAAYRNGVWSHYGTNGILIDSAENYSRDFPVISMAAAPNGTIWFIEGNRDSLYEFDGSTWKGHRDRFEHVAVGSNGMVWLANRHDDIATFDGQFWSTGIIDIMGEFRSFAFDPAGNILVATTYGIIKYDGTQQAYVGGKNLPGYLATIDFDRDGHMWVGSADRGNEYAFGEGLARHDGTSTTRYTVYNSGLTDQRVSIIRAGSDGTIWLRTHAGGLLLFNPRIAAGVEREQGAIGAARIDGIYPNPTTGNATVELTLDRRADVRISLHDALGREIRTALDAAVDAGEREVVVNTEGLPSGSYFIRIVAGGIAGTRMVTVTR